jgi:hypothetical protein
MADAMETRVRSSALWGTGTGDGREAISSTA